MVDVSDDEELISHVRSAVGATDAAKFPDDELKAEIDDAKLRINREVREIADRNQFDFYDGSDAAKNALISYVELRVSEVVRQRTPDHVTAHEKVPTSIGKLRRAEFSDSTTKYRQSQLITHLNNISE